MVRLNPTNDDVTLALVDTYEYVEIMARYQGKGVCVGIIHRQTGILTLDKGIQASGLPVGPDGAWQHDVA